MNTLYNFATGPLAWLAFVVCIGGIIWRVLLYSAAMHIFALF